MNGVRDWIRTLSYFIIFSAFVGIIMPGEKYKKYITLCLGLVQVLILLTPIVSWLKTPQIPVTDFFKGMQSDSTGANAAIRDYEEIRQEWISKSFTVQAKSQLDGLLSGEGYALTDLEITTEPDFTAITTIRAVVRKRAVQRGSDFIYIEPIENENTPDADITKLKNLISGFYNMSPDNIYIEAIKG